MDTTSRQSPGAPSPTSAGSILLIRPRFLGDVCLTLPVIDNLRRLAPQAALHYLTEEDWAPLLEGDPRLARVWVHPRRGSPLARAVPGRAEARAFRGGARPFLQPAH